jgi:hypothetical protein
MSPGGFNSNQSLNNIQVYEEPMNPPTGVKINIDIHTLEEGPVPPAGHSQEIPARLAPTAGSTPTSFKPDQKMKLGTLNMRGNKDKKRASKILLIMRAMRQNKVVILALQETHYKKEEAQMLGNLHPQLIFCLSGEETTKGVGFVIDKTSTSNIEMILSHVMIIKIFKAD